ncbi:NADH-ubiquinone dehydrogenase [Mesorhizobium sp. CAU 1732]|uniref:NADH-ubiquinone dehydrogenase n=1 Tax=Mesorhizobium sp. CAU 1732 TaxID=3140358 RepID=UPI003260ACC0
MSKPSMPNGMMPDMKQFEDMTKAYQATMPQEFAGAANLLAHPVAGAAAMGALGLGVMGHVFGMWMGAMAGAAEASQRLMDGSFEPAASPADPKPAKLTLVSSLPESKFVRAPAAKAAKAKRANAPRVAAPKAVKAETVAATSTMVKPKAAAAPAKPDDLKGIAGIGPKLETVLNGLGLWTFGQIAALDVPEIAWLDDHLGFAGRIGRDDWVGQAKTLGEANGTGTSGI